MKAFVSGAIHAQPRLIERSSWRADRLEPVGLLGPDVDAVLARHRGARSGCSRPAARSSTSASWPGSVASHCTRAVARSRPGSAPSGSSGCRRPASRCRPGTSRSASACRRPRKPGCPNDAISSLSTLPSTSAASDSSVKSELVPHALGRSRRRTRARPPRASRSRPRPAAGTRSSRRSNSKRLADVDTLIVCAEGHRVRLARSDLEAALAEDRPARARSSGVAKAGELAGRLAIDQRDGAAAFAARCRVAGAAPSAAMPAPRVLSAAREERRLDLDELFGATRRLLRRRGRGTAGAARRRRAAGGCKRRLATGASASGACACSATGCAGLPAACSSPPTSSTG